MVFNSFEFLIFLPVVFLLYWFVFKKNQRLQNLFLVSASYFFYGWWDWRFLILIAFTSLCSWVSSLWIGRSRQNNIGKAKAITAANIVINLLILGVFKYYNFFVQSFADLFLAGQSNGLLLKIILPVGISFYTFQALSYSIDVYRGKIEPTKDIVAFFAYVSFFPQLVAGPIERATNLLPQFQQGRTFDYNLAADGMRQMLWGFFKKVVVADNCAVFVNAVWDDIPAHSGSTLFVAAVLFAFQIYGDFSGYSDIAIGCAKLFGIKLKRNFSIPYFSRDMAEFWRRWHISLTTWFRDYLYIPLGGSRVNKVKILRNTLIIFLVSGFWHGANWTFIIWGAYHALLFLPLILLGKNRKYTNLVAEGKAFPSWKELGQMILTFALVVIGWIIFRAENIYQADQFICAIFTQGLLQKPLLPFAAIYITMMIVVEWIQREKEHGLQFTNHITPWLRYPIYYALIFLCFFCSPIDSAPFIYFQF
ncbi:MAG: MBOAT family protein [Bacteroidales bacterium]|nr:MBOAT family protein [Bacteroidales bacterium]